MERDTTYPQIHHHLERNQGLCQQTEVSLLHQVYLEGKLKTVGRKSCLFLSSPHSSLLIQGIFLVYENSIRSVALSACEVTCFRLSFFFPFSP